MQLFRLVLRFSFYSFHFFILGNLLIIRSARSLYFGRRIPSANLVHQREEVADSPVVSDFAVLHAHHVNRFEMNFAMGRGNSKKWAVVRAVISLVCYHAIAVSELPVNLGTKVRKGLSHVLVEFSDASLIGRGSGLSSVIDEIVGEEFFENGEVSLALDLFIISTDNGFRRI